MTGNNKIYLNQTPLDYLPGKVEAEMIFLGDIKFNKIAHYDRMLPFFMSLTGPGDHWMFISSNGALTAGRRDPANSLFPYTTDDKITDSAAHTGSKTILKVQKSGKVFLWEPFSTCYAGSYQTERNIYKSLYGNILIFEEINHTLEIGFTYCWQFSKQFGFVRTSSLNNSGKEAVKVYLTDGIQNILPYGVDEGMQRQYSTLVDAYKKSELVRDSGIGVYYLSSVPTDKAEPSEGLKATTVFSTGLEESHILLSATQLDTFRKGGIPVEETDIRALRGAYFVYSMVELTPADRKEWRIVAELEQDRTAILALKEKLSDPQKLSRQIEKDLDAGTQELIRLISRADGIQLSHDEPMEARHLSNVLYNCMRGGVFPDQYRLDRNDFLEYLATFNLALYTRYSEPITTAFPGKFQRDALLTFAGEQSDADLWRLCMEYLPLTFSRRHGDPSRPWNRFYINNQHPDGSPRLDYQGNWRDIFQNWEALAFSFPGYLNGMICRFLNASTADGYNPYRIMKSGIDWETIDPDDPWSNIGYWGDHQIIYLLKLLEASEQFFPGQLEDWLNRESFVYTHLPYRIKNFRERMADPRDTIRYDDDLEAFLKQQLEKIGSDGKLLLVNGGVYHVNLVEKLLVPVLAKISNLVVDGGIWMNTQRPEWNDANNALVGNGLSMVTVYYLRRHLAFLAGLLRKTETDAFSLSVEVAEWIGDIAETLGHFHQSLKTSFNADSRGRLLASLGNAMDRYLDKIYGKSFSGKRTNKRRTEMLGFIELLLEYVEGSIQHNQRKDGLYHAYNLMHKESDGSISVSGLQEMLEGQVAVLSSGYLDTLQSLSLLQSLRKSAMYREDQQSYTLYPNTMLPRFMEKNIISPGDISAFTLLRQSLEKGDFRLVKPDGKGNYQFNGSFRNRADVEAMIRGMASDYSESIIRKETVGIAQLFERSFGHHAFTGRSGTFYKYEGLGSIYWHMVSKLVLAIEEIFNRSLDEDDAERVRALGDFYYETREGLGLHKSPEQFGAYTTDPYSHTPGHAGVQQPGMTGQVKEDLLCRWKELGLVIEGGRLLFRPRLLNQNEFLEVERVFTFYNQKEEVAQFKVPPGAMAFTFCQVPVVYYRDAGKNIRIRYSDGEVAENYTNELSFEESLELFRRTGKIEKIEVFLEGKN